MNHYQIKYSEGTICGFWDSEAECRDALSDAGIEPISIEQTNRCTA